MDPHLSERSPSRFGLFAFVALLTWLVALRFHLGAAVFADLPVDAVRGLERLIGIVTLSDLAWRGNPVGAAFFGVADDYVMAPFVVGADSLEALLKRAAWFHALVAPIGALVGLALGRPMLGLAWGLMLALFPDLAALSRDYPVNYRTTHWALLAWVVSLLMTGSELSRAQRTFLTWTLLLAGALMVASHPLAAAALPAVLLVVAVYGSWRTADARGGRPAFPAWLLPALLCGLVFVPYAVSNITAVEDLLMNDRGDQGMSLGAAWRGSLAGMKALPAALADFPGGVAVVLALLPGLVVLPLSDRGRPVAVFTLVWTMGSLFTFAVAGYSASPWHLFPLVLPVLGSGLAGWFLFLDNSQRWPLPRARSRLADVLSIVLVLLALPSLLRASPPDEAAPVKAYASLVDRVVETAGDRPFQYVEAQSRCAVDWSAAATLLDLRLRGARLSADANAPLIAVVEDVEALAGLELPGERERIRLANGMVVRLFVTDNASLWQSTFRAACGLDREPNSRDVWLEPGGTGEFSKGGSCLVAMPCPSYLAEEL